MSARIIRTYASRRKLAREHTFSSPPPSDLFSSSSPPTSPSRKRKREDLSDVVSPKRVKSLSRSRANLSSSPRSLSLHTPRSSARTSNAQTKSTKSLPKAGSLDMLKEKPKPLAQLHFVTDRSIFRTCSKCNLSYTVGAPDDETLHRAHCLRVRKGMEWGREEERDFTKAGAVEVASGLVLKRRSGGPKTGAGNIKAVCRIICVRADVGGKIGTKLTTLMSTINRALSSPPLTPEALAVSKVYLFLLEPQASIGRERIAGCVVVQRIETAMAVAHMAGKTADSSSVSRSMPLSDSKGAAPPESLPKNEERESPLDVPLDVVAKENKPPTSTPSNFANESLLSSQEPPSSTTCAFVNTKPIPVDASTGIFCYPVPLSTPMGISRIFVPAEQRHRGIATRLLNAAAATFVRGCPLDPARGEIAFSQPTGDGAALMRSWGSGKVRIYQE